MSESVWADLVIWEHFAVRNTWVFLEATVLEGLVKWLHSLVGAVPKELKNKQARFIASCREGQRDIIERLLNEGISVDCTGALGYTGFIWACVRGDIELAEFLLKKGASVEAQTDDGTTPLMIAALRGQTHVVEFLLQSGNWAGKPNYRGFTALMWASHMGHLQIVISLLREGAEVNKQDEDGETALMRASDKGHWDLARTLLNAGAVVDIVDKAGETALMRAAQGGFADIVRLLLLRGKADPNRESLKGKTALTYAKQNGHKDVASILETSGAQGSFERWLKKIFGKSRGSSDRNAGKRRVSGGHGERLVLGFYGSASAGKSSAIKVLFGFDVGRVCAIPGTTKYISEWTLPNGVWVADTPGLQDVNEEQEQISKDFFDNTDIFVFLINADGGITDADQADLELLKSFNRPLLVLLNKIDCVRDAGKREEFVRHQRQVADVPSDNFHAVAFDPFPEICRRPINLAPVRNWIDSMANDRGRELLRQKQMCEMICPLLEKLSVGNETED